MKTVLPGGTLGILGGGQLGRMMALSARTLGFQVQALDPDPACPARWVVDQCYTADFGDARAAAQLARACEVVTLEIEKIPLSSLRAAAEHAPVRPSAAVLEIVQHRGRQKAWLAKHGFPLGPWREVNRAEELTTEVTALGGRCFVKSCEGGYDGRGQVVVKSPAEAPQAWRELGERAVVVEATLDLEAELSVLVARSPQGETAVYPPAFNHHEDRILAWSLLPGPVSAPVAAQAADIARAMAHALQVEGLLVVELFLLKDGTLLVNELAPRPHNSFHATEVACLTSQFEQAVRAVCNLPLGSVEVVRPAAIVNLLGDLWLNEGGPRFEQVLAMPGVRLHLYGKRDARKGRKMGHLSAVGTSPEEALARVKAAAQALGM
ncbi:5-(carboxyamino)imidazole ribonucleotide synthase [Stigmatella aurantiaca]|uniref:N5-carboxyaminoimidazole ribonucleotide synthase n=1 Tax=Stigmatella aurantiaca (strain DW4/3-1) TaxID=378806 RepID=Q093T4_STIAD|nr:5-(carboxyamino)imidazole ribonucleotide synthase [Stigmatella aurantiaca]ADO71048.1 Phosphoribosylaminoimidazole carboxylase, ATPase subunit [Stigmatella aurantiaca DW4/3-1]EAU66997.1 phosphoribosylaminoimidazole carboxylase, ATPase subunit [Stigmatella aurantiaca DW4/3-1]